MTKFYILLVEKARSCSLAKACFSYFLHKIRGTFLFCCSHLVLRILVALSVIFLLYKAPIATRPIGLDTGYPRKVVGIAVT